MPRPNPSLPTTTGDCARRIGDIVDALEKLQAHDKLTRTQEEQFEELTEELTAVKRQSILLGVRDGSLRVERGTPCDSYGTTEDRQHPLGQAFTSQRDQARRTIDAAHRSAGLPDHAAERATRLLDAGPPTHQSLAARWATATGSPAYLRAFTAYVADSERGHLMWTDEEREAWQRVQHVRTEMRAMSLTDAAGGFMVPLSLDPAIILSSSGSTNPLRRISRVVQTLTDSWNGITSAGVTASWDPEAAEVSDDAPTLAQPTIPVYKGQAFVPYSFEVGMDAVNFLAELQGLLVDGLDQLMATAYTTGTGTAEPTGIITALTGTASEINAAADDTFARGDVYNLQNQLPPRFQANAQWCAALPIINAMSQMETTAGARLFPEISEGRLLNRPLNELSNMDSTVTTTGAVSNFILVYGDWRHFVVVDRVGAVFEPIPHLMGANRRPTGQRGALLWARTGSDSVVDNAFRMLDVASAA